MTGNSFDPAAAGLGTFNVTYIFGDSLGCVDSASVTVVVDACVSVPEIDANSGIAIIPNPAGSNEPLIIQINQAGALQIEVFDAVGKRVYISKEQSSDLLELPWSVAQPGVYLVRVTDQNNEQRTARFTIR